MEGEKKRLNPYPIIAIILVLLLFISFLLEEALGWFVLSSIYPLPVIGLILMYRRSIHFLAQLQSLLAAGYPLPEALALVRNYQPKFRKGIDRVIADLENGSRFAEACRRRLRRLPRVVHRLLEEGEKQGDLPRYIQVYLEYVETKNAFLSQMSGVLVYSISVLAVCLVLTGTIMVFIVPVFEIMFADFGENLPWMTRISVEAAHLFSTYIIWVLLAAVAVYIIMALKSGKGLFFRFRQKLDTILMLLLTRFTVQKGEGLAPALAGAAGVPHYKGYGRAVSELETKTANGAGWLDALKAKPDLPPDLVAALASGADSGDIPGTLDQFVLAYREQYRLQMWTTSAQLIVATILIYGFVFGFLTISVYMAIFRIATAV